MISKDPTISICSYDDRTRNYNEASFTRYSTVWLRAAVLECKNERKIDRSVSLDKEQFKLLIEFLQQQYDAMELPSDYERLL
jgi:hypothetical protein